MNEKEDNNEKIERILHGNIYKTFMILALPGILMVVIQAFLPILDGLIVYKYAGSTAGAAINYASSIHSIFILGAQGLSSAGSALIGATNGRGDFEQSKKISSQLVSLNFIIAIVIMPVIFLIGLLIVNTSSDVNLGKNVLEYNNYLVFSLPFVFFQRAYIYIKNVFGEIAKGFFLMLIFVPLKILLSYIYVGYLGWGVEGSAFSTISAYLITGVYGFYDLFYGKNQNKLSVSQMIPDMKIIRPIMKRGTPSFLQNSLKSASFLFMKFEVQKYGDKDLAANGIASDISNLYQQLTACYESAIISFVSINMGAGNGERAKKSAYFAIKLGMISSVVFLIIGYFVTPYFVDLYTKDPIIKALAIKANLIFLVGILCFSVMFNEMPAMIGLGKNKESLFIQMMRIWVIRTGSLYATYLLFPGIGVYAVFISLTVANIGGSILSHLIFRKIKWK